MKNNQIDFAALALRIALGVMFVAHGLTKLFVFTPAGTAAYFALLGLPAIVAYGTIAFEIIGGAFLIFGLFTRIIALLTVIQMIVIALVHSANGWSFGNPGGGWEYPAFMALTALALFFIGAGKFSVCGLRNR
ncbi:DoxX family protein [Utexia brackfieldae]|uniref:DoxX family protein n=1 Tax=Utexia brackfieldae TaxID=3074108 RepID=UPI00370D9CA8